MRVIAGRAKGRRLAGPEGTATRPMTDRAKEGLFSAIAGDVPGANIIDLYAGSGSLGLEALSRGAVSVVFVERDHRAVEALRTNVEKVGLGGDVVVDDVPGFLSKARSGASFDLAFVDPPYALSLPSVIQVLDALVIRLDPGSLVVLHRRAGEARPEVGGLVDDGERRYGTAQIWRYRKPGESESPGARDDSPDVSKEDSPDEMEEEQR